MNRGLKLTKQIHPKETANFLSAITFFYSIELFKKGFRKNLDENELYEVLSSCRSKTLGDRLETQWQIDKKKHKKPSLIRVLWACFGKTYLLFGLVQLVMRTVLVVTMPEAIGKLISYFSPGQKDLSKEEAYYYAALVIILNIINFVYLQNYHMLLTEFGIRVRTAICSFVYRKALKMSDISLSEITMGKIITLITKDVYAIEMIIFFGNDIWIGLVETVIICYLIYRRIGPATFAGIGLFFCILPLQLIIGKMSTSMRLNTSKKTDERIHLTQEMLSYIKTIKMYVWEKFYIDKISLARKKEVNSIFKLFILKITIIVIGGLSTKIAFYLLIMSYIWMGNYLTAEIVYFIKSCFHKLGHLLSMMLPLGISFGAEVYATFIRLGSILEADELSTLQNHIELTTKDPAIILYKASASLGKTTVIKEATMKIQKGLNIVTGGVGSGKTAFLKMILQDCQTNGNVTIYGKISYASQEPWLFPSTIKQNILFGEQLDGTRFRQVLQVCALNEDLNCLIEGENTIVGDNGVNLSKGQKARINLARSIYKKADIYLLDNCLAALDRNVSNFIFQKCILEFLKDKLCVFVTSNTEHVGAADKIIEISNLTAKCADNTSKRNFENWKEEGIVLLKETEAVNESNSIFKENQKQGKVDLATYKNYVRFGGGYVIFGLIMILFVIVQTIVSFNDKLVSDWVTLEQNLSNLIMENATENVEFITTNNRRKSILNLYSIIIVTSTALSLLKTLSFFAFNRKASINIHKTMLSKIANAKMLFFDSHFIGNVLNRFTKDLSSVDEHLPFVMNECFELAFLLMGIIFLVGTVNYLFLIPAAVFFVLAYLLRFVYLKTGRSLQRLEASTRSPLIGHLNATFEGLTTIRVFKAQDILTDEFDRHQDLYTSVNYILHNSMRSLAFYLDAMCSFFITLVIVYFLIAPMDTTVGNVGLAVTQSFHLTGLLQYGIRRWADFESQMTSVERALEYTAIDQENKSGKIVKDWPKCGKVEFDNVSMKYTNNNALKNISFTIDEKCNVGIVGRTGAGKSSVISALFRLYDYEGSIKIDNQNIQSLDVHFLRSNIAIIPQDPIIISGTVRDNIDPLQKYSDEQIWKAIKLAKLQQSVMSLTDKIGSGSNFSAGQKQLMCLARAIIRKNKIIVLDEATANLDNETDALVRNIIEENFYSCTVIIITHRLSSVLNSDLVIVVNQGRIVEIDKAAKLLENTSSLFANMVKLD